jgi:adenylyltransferase/sulfurtransferase
MSELTDEELDRYARQIVLPQVGGVGQKKLKAARIAVIGAGGIGSAVIPALAGAGVGHLTIVDCDNVDLPNLHRQLLYADSDQGNRKAHTAAAFVRSRNPFLEVCAVDQRIDDANAKGVVAAHDLVIDGSDNFATRLAVSDACVARGIPLVSAAAIQFQGQIGLFRAQPCYRCFVGDAFDAEDCDNCAELGVLGSLTAAAGSFAAMLALNHLLGIGGDQSGRVHLFDGEKLEWRLILIPADPNCRTCGSA